MPVGTPMPERLCLLDFSTSKNSAYTYVTTEPNVSCLAGTSMENMGVSQIGHHSSAEFFFFSNMALSHTHDWS